MKHDIKPIINEYLSCHQGLLATYASYQKREYDMIFSESWGFKYRKEDQPFGMSLDPDYQNRRELLLEKFHGIKVIDELYNDKNDLINLIQSKLLQSPVILHCDVFDCPWNISYQRNHIDHYVLITGLSDNLKQIHILDPYSTKDENAVDLATITPDRGEIGYFMTMPMNNLEKEDYFVEISNSLSHIDNTGFFQNLENFHNDFQTRFEEVMLSEYTDVYAIPLIINLRRIANQRYCYCIFLSKMISKNLLDPSMLNIMEGVAEKYGLLRILLIKQIMKKKSNKEGSDILAEIMSNEYAAYEKMNSFK